MAMLLRRAGAALPPGPALLRGASRLESMSGAERRAGRRESVFGASASAAVRSMGTSRAGAGAPRGKAAPWPHGVHQRLPAAPTSQFHCRCTTRLALVTPVFCRQRSTTASRPPKP
eukprot:scaffold2058_cov403-Prasinococcus_capsulatus_cf.AAC.8